MRAHSAGFERDRPALRDVPPEITFAFLPLHRTAFGIAVGVAGALAIVLLTAARLTLDPDGQMSVGLLAQYFYGYDVSWTGAIIGGAWGLVVGFVAGWFAAFVRNLTIATWIFLTRSRAELAATRDFLDHI